MVVQQIATTRFPAKPCSFSSSDNNDWYFPRLSFGFDVRLDALLAKALKGSSMSHAPVLLNLSIPLLLLIAQW